MTTDKSLAGEVNDGMSPDIDFEHTDGVAVATFNRPSALNAFRASTRALFARILERVEDDASIQAFVITGAGRAFSSGQDLEELAVLLADPDYAHNGAIEHLDELQALTARFLGLRKPVIAAINGAAVGLGAELALACDIRIAAHTASIGFVESQRGLFETNGVMYLLPRIVGYGHAVELLLTGDLISAADAGRIGLVSRVVEPEALLTEAMDLGRRLAANAPISVRLIKDVISRTYDVGLDEMMRLEVEGALTCIRSEDIRRGVEAFLTKRRPSYRGS